MHPPLFLLPFAVHTISRLFSFFCVSRGRRLFACASLSAWCWRPFPSSCPFCSSSCSSTPFTHRSFGAAGVLQPRGGAAGKRRRGQVGGGGGGGRGGGRECAAECAGTDVNSKIKRENPARTRCPTPFTRFIRSPSSTRTRLLFYNAPFLCFCSPLYFSLAIRGCALCRRQRRCSCSTRRPLCFKPPPPRDAGLLRSERDARRTGERPPHPLRAAVCFVSEPRLCHGRVGIGALALLSCVPFVSPCVAVRGVASRCFSSLASPGIIPPAFTSFP